MIHCMSECLDKLQAIKKLAQNGMSDCNNQVERHKFEQISMEVSYLINEASVENDKKRGDKITWN